MPEDNMGTCCKQKAVLVLVYEEMPRSCRNGIHRGGHPNKNRVVLHRSWSHSGKGYSRKAELLRYSQRLRESARSGASTPLPPNNHQSTDKAVTLQKKQKHKGHPACFGVLIPGFTRSSMNDGKKKTRSRSAGTKMSDVMKSFTVHKKRSFWGKLLHAVKKKRGSI